MQLKSADYCKKLNIKSVLKSLLLVIKKCKVWDLNPRIRR